MRWRKVDTDADIEVSKSCHVTAGYCIRPPYGRRLRSTYRRTAPSIAFAPAELDAGGVNCNFRAGGDSLVDYRGGHTGAVECAHIGTRDHRGQAGTLRSCRCGRFHEG